MVMLKAQVIGNLGSDPELRHGPTGTAMLRFNLAANYRAKNEQNEWAEKTEWVRCTVFGARAESLASLLKKGTKVYADGRLEARPWTDNQGQVRAGLELVADTVEFASSRQDDDQPRRPLGAAIPSKEQDDDSLPF
jgi:single-strand DNA-binding protein